MTRLNSIFPNQYKEILFILKSRVHSFLLFFFPLFFILIISIPSFASSPSPSPHVLAYYTGDEAALASLKRSSAHLDMLSIDVFNVQDDGSIVAYDDLGAADYAVQHNIQAYACVSNYRGEPLWDFDPALARAAIQTHKDTFIAQLLDLARDPRYAGVNIDLESIAYSDDIAADRAAFTAFIEEFAGKLHALDKQLIISVPAKFTDSPDDDWAYPYDLTALGKAADYLQLMTYDQHGPWGEPGPISALDWAKECTAYSASLVDPTKLLIGLPAYAYDWDTTDPDAEVGELKWTDITALLARPGAEAERDASADSPYLTYTENRHEHVVWYEDAASLRAKAALVSQYKLGGLSVWALGQEDESFW